MGLPRNVAVFSQAQLFQIILKCTAMILLLLQTYIILPYITTRNRLVLSTLATIVLYFIGVVVCIARDLYVIDIQQPWPLQMAYTMFILSYQIFGWISYYRFKEAVPSYEELSKFVLVWLVLETLGSIATIAVIILPSLETSTALYMLMVVIFSQTFNCVLTNGVYLTQYFIPLFHKSKNSSDLKLPVGGYIAFDMILHASYVLAFAAGTNYLTSIICLSAAIQFGIFSAITFRTFSQEEEIENESLPYASNHTSPRSRESLTESFVSVRATNSLYNKSETVYSSYSGTDGYTATEITGYTTESMGRTNTSRGSTILPSMVESNYSANLASMVESTYTANNLESSYTDITAYTYPESAIIDSLVASDESSVVQNGTTTLKPIATNFSYLEDEILIYSPNTQKIREMESIVIYSPETQAPKFNSITDSVDTEYLANKYGSLLEQFSPQ